ncbi:TolC family outer membrane protein [Actibacterium pelagium]|uniref:Transporter n=1 Tax=Actibacterium pelagium TaxID=2029103 RepID=A0A917AM03_9RHOB|nr:TolC family outer membrane protein [Actibacterium pelagium]GGE59140.1 transporter [Actibacterium pelagium]
MKIIFPSIVRAGLAAVIVSVGAGAASAETLTDAMVAAYKNSNLLDQNRALLRAADEDVAGAVAALRPVISFVANATDSHSDIQGNSRSASASISAELVLYDGGANQLGVDVAKETVLSTRAGLVGVEQQVLLGAVQAYMDVRSAVQNVLLSESNVRLITQELEAARDRFEVGEVTRTDVSIAEAALAAARSNRVANQGQLNVAREAYRQATGKYPGNLAANVRLPKLPRSQSEARAIALRTHPSIIASQHEVKVAELNVLRTRKSRGPNITAGASIGRTDGGNDNSSVSLTLRQPIYQGGALRALERRAIQQKEATRAGLLNTTSLIDQSVGNAWASLAVSRAQITASGEQIRAAQLAFEGTQEEAKLGARTTLDVLDAEQNLLDARAARIRAEADQYVAIFTLMASMGLLTAENLNLGIQTYDPTVYYNAVKAAPIRSFQGDQLDGVLKRLGKEAN